MASHIGYSITSKTCEWTCVLYILIPRVGFLCLYILRSSSRALAVFVLYILFSHLLSSSLSHPPPHIFSLTYYITHLLSSIFYPASSIRHLLSHIVYHISFITFLLSRIFRFAFRIWIFRFAFAFAFIGLHLHSSFWICIFRFAFRILHQTIHIQWVSHSILLFRICNLHTEYYNTSIGMSHSNPEQFASTAMQSARSRLLELPNEASIGLSPTT